MKTNGYYLFGGACLVGATALVACTAESNVAAAGGDTSGVEGVREPQTLVSAAAPVDEAGESDGGANPTGENLGARDSDAAPSPETQLPPTGGAPAIAAWIAKGYYKSWACEAAPHAARSPGAHGINRVCSNKALSTHGTGEFPVGAAGVKEIYDAAGTAIVGYATYRKTASGGGDTWYWYEATAADGVIANGLGNSGVPKSVCVSCHTRAGVGRFSGHDFVFTQVKP